MDLTHRVGVVFHASDRLTRTLDKYAEKYTGLEKHQKAVEAGTRSIGKQEEALARARARHAAAEQQADMQRVRMNRAMMASRTALKNLEERALKEQQELWNQYYAKVTAATERQAALERTQKADRLALEAKFQSQMTALSEKAATQRAAYDAKVAGMNQQRTALIRRAGMSEAAVLAQGGILSQGGYRSAVMRRTELEAQMQTLGRAKRALYEQVYATAIAEGAQTTVAEATARNAAARAYGRATGDVRSELAPIERRIEAHERLVELDHKRVLLERQHTEQLEASATRAIELEAQQKRALAELTAAQKELAAARLKADEDELLRAERIFQEKTEQHEKLIAQKQELATADAEIHAKTLANLQAESTARMEALSTAEEQLATEEALTAATQRRAAILAGIRSAMGHVSAGFGMMLGGAMGLAVLGWGAVHMAHEADSNQRLKTDLAMSIYGQRTSKARTSKLWSDMLTAQVVANNARVPGLHGVAMDQNEQLNAVLGLVSSGIKPGESSKILTPMLQMLSYARNKGDKSSTLESDLAKVYEITGVRTLQDAERLNNALVRSIATSKYMSVRAYRDIVLPGAQMMRGAGMTFDAASMDFLNSVFKTPATTGTQLDGFISQLVHPESKKSRAWLSTLSKRTGLPLTKSGGMFMQGMTVSGAALRLTNAVYAAMGVKDPSKATPTQVAEAAAYVAEGFPGKRGRRVATLFLDPAQREKQRIDQERADATPNLFGQMAARDTGFTRQMSNFHSNWNEFQRVMGSDLMPSLTGAFSQLNGMLTSVTTFAKAHPRQVQAVFETAKWMGSLVVLGGAARALWGVAQFATAGGVGKVATWLWGLAKVVRAGQAVEAAAAVSAETSMVAAVARGGAVTAAGRASAASLVGTLLGTALTSPVVLAAVTAAGGILVAALIAAIINHEDSPETKKRQAVARASERRKEAAWRAAVNHPMNQWGALPMTGSTAMGGSVGVAPTAMSGLGRDTKHEFTLKVQVQGDSPVTQKVGEQIVPALSDAIRKVFPAVGPYAAPGLVSPSVRATR